jgi:F0F1-type ATP synthase epsilon subunit
MRSWLRAQKKECLWLLVVVLLVGGLLSHSHILSIMLARTFQRNLVKAPMRALSTAAAATGPELKLTFTTPHNPIYVDKVVSGLSLPGEQGYYGVLANKTPVIGQLQPGLVTVYHVGGEEEKFFVSGGFAFSREDSTTDIACPEANLLEDYCPDAVKAQYAEASKDYASSQDAEKAAAYVKMTTLQELSRAMGINI